MMVPKKEAAPRPRGVRYVDVRLAIPDDAPFPSSVANSNFGFDGYDLLARSASAAVPPLLAPPPRLGRSCSRSNQKSAEVVSSSSSSSLIASLPYSPASSSCTFVPLGMTATAGNNNNNNNNNSSNKSNVDSCNFNDSLSSLGSIDLKEYSPPVSPLDYRKAALSPALTATTIDCSEHTLSSRRSLSISSPTPTANYNNDSISSINTFEREELYCRPVVGSGSSYYNSYYDDDNDDNNNNRKSRAIIGTTSPYKTTPPPPTPSESIINKRRGAKSPFVHNNDDVHNRKQRVKTELCMHYLKNTPCPFGDQCTFAHGEEELQKKTLLDLCASKMVDGETYRTKPCLMWVSTGSCPFGKRCSSMHDKGVANESASSWLPHTVTQGNSLETDMFVESLYHKRLYSLLYSNPFGAHFSLQNANAEVLYRRVCNLNSRGQHQEHVAAGGATISTVHKVDIALQMRGPADWGYIFKPQHIIHGALCMVLQKRAFLLAGAGATELPISSYNPCSPSQCLVWELAFGPNGAEWGHPSVRPVGLYFNIQEADVITCTPQQAKRYRWKPNKNKKEERNVEIERLEFFEMVRPHDACSFYLATRILECYLEELRLLAFPALDARSRQKAAKSLALEKADLKEVMNAHIAHWKRWAWPIQEGREQFDEDTPVPPVDADYKPSSMFSSFNDTAMIWNSFLSNLISQPSSSEVDNISASEKKETTSGSAELFKMEKTRLSIFQILALGKGVNPDRSLPHITNAAELCATLPSASEQSPTSIICMRGERCWKSLLLEQAPGREWNDWDIVREHFGKSRSKKVLSILQQQ